MLKNTNKTNRHCEQREAISSRLPRARALAMTEQNGRSMVEMLGVLAVIGVLSITGISGYTTAMNKHRANEILDAASKRAVVVSTQLQSGRTNPTLAEFGDDTVQGVSFSLKATNGSDWATGQERFAIQTSAIDEDICREIYNISGTSGTVREMYSGSNTLSSSSGCSDTASAMRFVYNNDLTNTAITSDYKDQASCTAATKKWCSGWTTPGCADDCCTGKSSDCCNASTGELASASKTCDYDQDGTADDGTCNASGICEEAATCDGKTATISGINYCFKSIGSKNYNHFQAYDACVADGMTLATTAQVLAVMGTDCEEISSSQYDCSNLNSKLGINTSAETWLADCSGCDLADHTVFQYSTTYIAAGGTIRLGDYARDYPYCNALCVKQM